MREEMKIVTQDPVPGNYAGKRQGYHLVKFSALSSKGEEMGYLKVAYIPSENLESIEVPERIIEFAVDKPYIDYIKVHEPYRRRGMATSLYAYGAKYFGSKGMTLKGVSLQQREATAVWEKMAQNPEYPTVPFMTDNGYPRYYLDYRESQNVLS